MLFYFGEGIGNDNDINYQHWNNMQEFVSDGTPSIAGFNSDLDLSSKGTIHVNDFGDHAVFTWNEVGTHKNENALLSFQVQLFDTGKIVISYNGILDDSGEDFINDLDEGIVVGISAGLEASGIEQGLADLRRAFTVSGAEIYNRWCFDAANSCGFNDSNGGLPGAINTAFNLDQRSIIYNPGTNGFSVNEPISYAVGGTVTGLAAGNSIVLQNNVENDLTLNANGDFSFSSPIFDGSTYAVTVATQPTLPSQTCIVTNGSGILTGDNIDNVAISCTTDVFPTYIIGGNITGLAAGNSVVLQNNANDTVSVNANGAFSFPTALTDGNAYAVTVLTQPTTPSQTCAVSNGTGTISGIDIATVSISCSIDTIPTYTIGGNVTGLATGNSVVLANKGDSIAVNVNGAFTFPAALADGSSYITTVSTQPPNQACTITNGFGSLAGVNVVNISINCITTTTGTTYTIGGSVTGLATGGSLALSNNGDVVSVNVNGSFTFPTALVNGRNYLVVVSTQPISSNQTCRVSNGNGTIPDANITNVVVSCTASGLVNPGSANPIPTLGEWARILLALILALTVWRQIRHGRERVGLPT